MNRTPSVASTALWVALSLFATPVLAGKEEWNAHRAAAEEARTRKDAAAMIRNPEAAAKSADLARHGVQAFATHGVMAGELSGAAGPGQILTPPAPGSAQDDELRLVMRKRRADPQFAHLLFRAPFAVVGEGGTAP